jgi:hypothetical protein
MGAGDMSCEKITVSNGVTQDDFLLINIIVSLTKALISIELHIILPAQAKHFLI